MSEVSKKTNDDAEHRKDGSKVATEADPTGETETEHVSRVERERRSSGPSREYDESDESDIGLPPLKWSSLKYGF